MADQVSPLLDIQCNDHFHFNCDMLDRLRNGSITSSADNIPRNRVLRQTLFFLFFVLRRFIIMCHSYERYELAILLSFCVKQLPSNLFIMYTHYVELRKETEYSYTRISHFNIFTYICILYMSICPLLIYWPLSFQRSRQFLVFNDII